jgi:hypothetical protein
MWNVRIVDMLHRRASMEAQFPLLPAHKYAVSSEGLLEVVTDKGYHSGAGSVQMRGMGRADVYFCSQATAAEVGKRGRSTSGGVRQQTAGGRPTGKESFTEAWGISGAAVCAPVRDRRDAQNACTGRDNVGKQSLAPVAVVRGSSDRNGRTN